MCAITSPQFRNYRTCAPLKAFYGKIWVKTYFEPDFQILAIEQLRRTADGRTDVQTDWAGSFFKAPPAAASSRPIP